jgi:hypothetical protein
MNSTRGRRLEQLFLALLFLFALGVRLYRVGQPSLSEDEATKWEAIQQYRKGHFAGVNSEHPMVMKMMAWGSLDAGEALNRWIVAHGSHPVRREVWLRLPIVLFGAATAVFLYLLGRQMLGFLGAGLAGFFWAVSPLSVSLNCMLKEESLFACFSVLAFYLYNRGKQAATARESKRWFTLSGIIFGLDQASFYLAVGEFGLIVLVWDIANRVGIRSRQMGPYFRRMILAGTITFVALNPVILSPKNVEAMIHYTEQDTVQHHGYLMDGHIYLNNFLTTPYGLPWYFYLWVLAVKTPLPILGAAAAGILLLFLDQDSLISIFVRVNLVFWIVPYSLAGSKWIRYVAIALPWLYLAGGWAVEKLSAWSRGKLRPIAWRTALAGLVLALTIWPTANLLAWAPYNRLFLNALGGGKKNAGQLFPPDEVYDLGVREAAAYVCRVAPRGARLATSDPRGMRFYMHVFGREDIHVMKLFSPDYKIRPGDYLLIQDSRRYFETNSLINLVEKIRRPIFVRRIDGLVVAEVYRF